MSGRDGKGVGSGRVQALGILVADDARSDGPRVHPDANLRGHARSPLPCANHKTSPVCIWQKAATCKPGCDLSTIPAMHVFLRIAIGRVP